MAATTSTTGDQPPPPQTTATTTTPKPPTLVIPSPLIRPTPTITPQFHHRHHHDRHRNHHHHPHQVFRPQNHIIPQLSEPFDTIRYPLASSGRGLIPGNYRPTAVGGGGRIRPEPVPEFSKIPGSGDHVNSRTRGFLHYRPLLKVGSSPYSIPDSNFPKDLIVKKPDDPLVTLRDRKVRLSDSASVYALCRSWLRNGYPEENQPQYGDVLMSLPKPLPPLKSSSPKRKERDDETEVDEVDTNDYTSAKELLTRLIKRAKRVRARLREERSQRIERYESRLTYLLQSRNDGQNSP